MIECRDLWFEYPSGERALRGVSFAFDGRVLALVGPNASGKTTLLKVLAALLKPTRGEVRVGGVNPWEFGEAGRVGLRRKVVYVHEKPILFRGTVLDNLTYPLRLRGVEKARAVELAREALSLFGVEGLARASASALSAGQARLVSLARAMVVKPAYLLLDEPTAHLDRGNAKRVLSVLKELALQGTKLVLATHTREALEVAEAAAVLNRGELVAFCKPDELGASLWPGPP